MIPRGVRLNNPGNIRLSNAIWAGMVQEQMDPAFITFASPEYGIRAIARVLMAYEHRGIHTVRDIINRWAPPADHNPTDAYVSFVAAAADVKPDEVISIKDHLPELIAGIIHFEQGEQPYSASLINTGIGMALA
jgi:hypothetical protein